MELSEGDIFRSLEARADVYVLKNILHDWDDQACATILSTVRAAMPAGSRLVIVEYLQERNREHVVASISDIQMMNVCDDGRERSAEELQALLEGAGLRPGAVAPHGRARRWSRDSPSARGSSSAIRSAASRRLFTRSSPISSAHSCLDLGEHAPPGERRIADRGR